MKKTIALTALLAALMLACSITGTPTPPPATEPPATEPPVVTEPPAATNVTCNELALYLDPALASGYTCETIPENTFELETYPEHTRLVLQGYPLSGKFFEPKIMVFPVAAYTALLPDSVPGVVSSLQALTGGGPAPVFDGKFDSPRLPFLPRFNAGQVFFAHYQVLPFVDGAGIRFLAQYAQYSPPLNNNDLFYTYQALTGDGQYWVSVILPVNHAMLPADAMDPPGGVSWEEFSNNYEPYVIDMVNQLNAQAPDSFLPTLAALDALVGSITIQP